MDKQKYFPGENGLNYPGKIPHIGTFNEQDIQYCFIMFTYMYSHFMNRE